MVIFHSYASLPEGIYYNINAAQANMLTGLIVQGTRWKHHAFCSSKKNVAWDVMFHQYMLYLSHKAVARKPALRLDGAFSQDCGSHDRNFDDLPIKNAGSLFMLFLCLPEVIFRLPQKIYRFFKIKNPQKSPKSFVELLDFKIPP